MYTLAEATGFWMGEVVVNQRWLQLIARGLSIGTQFDSEGAHAVHGHGQLRRSCVGAY